MLTVAGLLAFVGRAWRRESRTRTRARVPKLEILPGTITSQHHHRIRIRIRVRNLSPQTIRFAAELAELAPGVGYPLPARLRILGSAPPHREAELAGHGEALVEVLAYRPALQSMRFGFAEEGYAVDAPARSYCLTVCAFPVLPGGGAPVRRRFRVVVAAKDNTATLVDDGEPRALR